MILKRWLVGDPLKTAQARHERLSKTIALAIFSSNAISSYSLALLRLFGRSQSAWPFSS